ncbi:MULTISPECIES: ribonuclease D [unclassified Mesorhizobium]|uniref:ribonuclease D n=1 Tax=unclassified Mesorhizobium TaxID=325217 RepID=UPI000FCA17CD|nr:MULTISPECIES: ribonuclease D [unclassified Mesorhizobium]RUX74101.1 ribonuclease D [Mesorhizobium sp. M7A.F.Ca.US.005.03.1.1]RUY12500.1 ribonuclease D [Mesorhizobium sp. M7A.F.Ca.US.005.03.2.1]RUY31716.1 ribonuclease D [Mesorhizobium sp. M7A.F.Ca.US.001.04.2.1]RUY37653.1 ribonuclease D [Mesorhizobium sp. M7A.F.Ca.US.001.04.1.1]RVA03247.1 ribonuclease D [Mesorhizobium sp. M7A.F.Ca.US.001.02.1.1]
MHVITTQKELETVLAAFEKSDFVTVDTEFIRETTFWPILCLIQMAAPGVTALIDPLAPDIDLKPFFRLMANEAVVKVFHAARQDIEIIVHLGDLVPHPVFDTQVAAMVCGFGDSVSYDQLVQRITGARLDKSSRFTDWRHRPLSDKQLDYALADVTHLIEVYQHLSAELERENRAHWLNEEMEVLTSRETYDPHPEDAWKRLKMRLRKPQELAIVQGVAAWREREARERDVPRGRVLKDDAIYEVAQQAPRDAAALGKLRTTPKGWERSSTATALLGAVNTALALPKEQMPKLPKSFQPPEGSSAAAELLKVLLRIVAEKEGVASKVLASSDDIDRIAAEGEEADVPALQGWRRAVFGEAALKLVRGEIGIKFDKRKIAVFDL